jgi:hypothetical protein
VTGDASAAGLLSFRFFGRYNCGFYCFKPGASSLLPRSMTEVDQQAETTSSDVLRRNFHRSAVQVGVVVRDVDATVRAFTEVFGIGPFRVVECPAPERQDQQYLRGAPVRFRTRQAFADLGNFELELIQPVEGTTIWSEFLERHGPGIHHIRFNTPELEEVVALLKHRGIGTTQEGAGIREGTYWANFDTEALLGFVIEIMKPLPGSDGRTPGTAATQEKTP